MLHQDVCVQQNDLGILCELQSPQLREDLAEPRVAVRSEVPQHRITTTAGCFRSPRDVTDTVFQVLGRGSTPARWNAPLRNRLI